VSSSLILQGNTKHRGTLGSLLAKDLDVEFNVRSTDVGLNEHQIFFEFSNHENGAKTGRGVNIGQLVH
jgi:hypothetical protein